MEDESKKRFRALLAATQVVDAPPGWVSKTMAVGGLIEIGFSSQIEHYLLIVSHSGRGLFNCQTLELIDRDYEVEFDSDTSELWTEGFGALKGEKVRVAGLYGGGLPLSNPMGDHLETMALDWPYVDIIFEPQYKSVFEEKDASACFKVFYHDVPRAWGFSVSGDIFVIATSHSLSVYRRA